MRSTNALPRKRGRPRGPGRKGKKLKRENIERQDFQSEQPDTEENSEGQNLQRVGVKQQDSLPVNGGNQSDGISSSAQLPTRKRL